MVLSSAAHTETGERLIVYFDKDNTAHWWARPASHFQGYVAKNNKSILRFRFIRKLSAQENTVFQTIEKNS